jgi:hypothetical protein
MDGNRIDKGSRRAFIKKTAYIAPTILTLKAVPAFASEGSGGTTTGSQGEDAQPSGSAPVNEAANETDTSRGQGGAHRRWPFARARRQSL